MDSKKITEVTRTYDIRDKAYFLMEDDDGTKIASFKTIKEVIQRSSFCDTINDLKILTLDEGVVITTLGYHKVGDGGAATYVITYDPGATDDGALCHFMKTSDTLRAKLVMEGSVSVMAFGAVGDGATDDYEALQKAIDSGVPITFPSNKVFKILSPLMIESGRKVNFNGCTINNPNSTAIQIGKNGDAASNVQISNVNIIGLRGIEVVAGCSDVCFDNVTIKGQLSSSEYGFRLLSDDNIRIIDCRISNVQYGIAVYTENSITDLRMISIVNTLIDAIQIAIQTSGGQSHSTYIAISVCKLTATVADGSCGAYFGSASDIVTMVACLVNNATTGINVVGSETSVKCYHVGTINCTTQSSGSVTFS